MTEQQYIQTVLRPVRIRTTYGYDPNGHEYEGRFHRFVEGIKPGGCSCKDEPTCYAVVELENGSVISVGLFDHDIQFMDVS